MSPEDYFGIFKLEMDKELGKIIRTRIDENELYTQANPETIAQLDETALDRIKKAMEELKPFAEEKNNWLSDFEFKPIRFEPEQEEVPVKVHKFRFNGKLSYHKRIQKKWNKRYGFKLTEKNRGYMFNQNALFGLTVQNDPRIMAIDLAGA